MFRKESLTYRKNSNLPFSVVFHLGVMSAVYNQKLIVVPYFKESVKKLRGLQIAKAKKL